MDNVNFELKSFLILCPSCGMRLVEVYLDNGCCEGECDHCLSSIGGYIDAKMYHTDESKTMCQELYEYVSDSSYNNTYELELICSNCFDNGYNTGYKEGEEYGYSYGEEYGYEEGYEKGIQDTMEKYNIRD